MIYRAIGSMSGSSLDGLDIVFTEIVERGGNWSFEILEASSKPYDDIWKSKLSNAHNLSAMDYQLLHTEFGHYTGREINYFIEKYHLQHRVNLVASHGHTTFHIPHKKMTAQLGDGAAIAAVTKLPVVSDLRAVDIALGGQGAPIVPIGEKLLFAGYDCFLNIGGIANISVNSNGKNIAFDICAANRVLNLLAEEIGYAFDKDGNLAQSGIVVASLLEALNSLDYYSLPYPKSLPNSFGTDVVYSLIKKAGISVQDALRTYTEHIASQIYSSVKLDGLQVNNTKLFVTGGGAFNLFLIKRLAEILQLSGIEVVVPETRIVEFKEAVIMALIGVLRWREETNVFSSVTGSTQDNIGGALWLGSTN
jgi:anhydro-N-acetylmuramic acid kinase